MFIVIGLQYDSAEDTLYELHEGKVESIVGSLQEYGFEDELKQMYGEEIAKEIMRAYEHGDMLELTGSLKKRMLQAVDEYIKEELGEKGESVFEKNMDKFVVYRLRVTIN